MTSGCGFHGWCEPPQRWWGPLLGPFTRENGHPVIKKHSPAQYDETKENHFQNLNKNTRMFSNSNEIYHYWHHPMWHNTRQLSTHFRKASRRFGGFHLRNPFNMSRLGVENFTKGKAQVQVRLVFTSSPPIFPGQNFKNTKQLARKPMGYTISSVYLFFLVYCT